MAARPGWLARRGHRRGGMTVGGDDTFGVAAEGIGVFSPWGTPNAGSRAHPGSACVPAGGPAVPSHVRASAAQRGRSAAGKDR
jgi:hypothetical protein